MSAETTYSHVAKPADRRCRWWQRICDQGDLERVELGAVDGANALPGRYLKDGSDVELPIWSVVFDGEARHHAKPRGWRFLVGFVVPGDDGGLRLVWREPKVQDKARAKADNQALAAGTGPHAALVRAALWALAAPEHERVQRIDQLTRVGGGS